MFVNTVVFEIKKALNNKLFLAAVLTGCVIVSISAFENAIGEYIGASEMAQREALMGMEYNTGTYMSPFGRWVGVEGYSLSSSILYFVFPFLICIPYGWSYCVERNSGYEKQVVLRCGKRTYYVAKLIAVFVSGGLTMLIPLVYHFLFLCLVYPLYRPLSVEMVYLGIFPSNLFSLEFYTHPFVYVALMCLLNFLFCGLLACVCLPVTFFVKNRIAVTLVPFAMLLGLRYIQQMFFTSETAGGLEINPMYFLNGMRATTNGQVVLIELAVLAALTLGPVLIWGKNHEIF